LSTFFVCLSNDRIAPGASIVYGWCPISCIGAGPTKHQRAWHRLGSMKKERTTKAR
jgi:hypothetical protein